MDKKVYGELINLLSKRYPSKYIKNKVYITNKLPKIKYRCYVDPSDGSESDESESDEDDSEYVDEDDSEYVDEDDSEYVDEDEDEDEDTDEDEDEEEDTDEDEDEEVGNKRKPNNLDKNYKRYKGIINAKNNDELSYFKSNLNNHQQESVINQLVSLNENSFDKPLRIQLLELNIPSNIKAIVLNKINTLTSMNQDNGEYNKLNSWIRTFMSIPFNVSSKLPISKEDGIDKCREYITNCKNVLDASVYGMNDAKIQFMQLIGQYINNPSSIGNSIALKGPMGTGKTTLLKNGICKLLNREIGFVTLGGANDGSYLEGHSYTYEGSCYGKIIDILIQCKTNNPIIYFDELDKVSDSPKGDEIIGILTHLTDITQNSEYTDKYFSEINIDMSKCLFIFSYNDESKVNKILRDRMYVIETTGYNSVDKTIICKNFLIPSIENTLKLDKNVIIFDDEVLIYIIENKTPSEKGVRNLKRTLETIYNKINLYTLMEPNTLLFNETIINNITFPYHVSKDIVDALIKTKQEYNNLSYMYL